MRLTGGIFATALGAAAQQMAGISPHAAAFFAAKAEEFLAFATPPTVASTSPQQDAAKVSPTDQVVIQFAVPMDETTLTSDLVYLAPASGGSHLAASLSYDPEGKCLTLVPTNPLSAGVSYKLTVSAGVQSVSGQPMQQDQNVTFTVAQ